MPEHSPQTSIKVDLFQSKASSRKRNKKDWSSRAPANYINIHQQISFHCLKFHHVCKKGFLHSIERWPLWWHKSHPPIAATPDPVTRSLALTESHPFLWKCVMFFHGYGRGWFGLPTSESSLGVESALSLVQILEENHRLTPELQIFRGVVLYVLCSTCF